nr:GNAT family N-acetyltransferase [Aquabacterium terrae]
MDLALIHRFLSEETRWARGIPRATVERSIAHSLCFGAYCVADGAQLGFARIVSDRATFAWLADVFVLPEQRGRGIAVALLQAADAHPELQGLRRRLLATSTAAPLYARHGWVPLAAPEIYMERSDPEVYQRAASPIPTGDKS